MNSSTNIFFHATLISTISYGMGYGYGKLYGIDKQLTSLVFVITSLSWKCFNAMVNSMTGGERENPRTFHTLHLIGGLIVGSLQIIAFRHFQLINGQGTAIFFTLLTMDSGLTFSQLIKN